MKMEGGANFRFSSPGHSTSDQPVHSERALWSRTLPCNCRLSLRRVQYISASDDPPYVPLSPFYSGGGEGLLHGLLVVSLQFSSFLSPFPFNYVIMTIDQVVIGK